jgi:molecular chaperone DnaK
MDRPEPAVGIDLGTTFSVVAYLDATGRPQTILNSEGDKTTPSVVFFDDSDVVVGKEALKAATLEPDKIAEHAKRDMGCRVFSKAIGGQEFPPEVIQAAVLERLARDARQQIGDFRKVVVTVPAYFNEPRRKATQDAARIAGLEVLDIINEPTAAAIAFGVREGFLTVGGAARQKERILVYDLGGGTFDVTLLEIDGKNYRAIGTAGDVYLGGLDWDHRLSILIADAYHEKYQIDLCTNPVAYHRLMREAEDIKRTLTARDTATIIFEHGGQGIRLVVTRDQFEQVTADLLERTHMTVQRVLREAHIGWDDITRVLIVGGSTRMPMVARMLENESGKQVDRSLSADEAVAHGAALYAGLLIEANAGETPTFTVVNISSHDLGVLAVEGTTGRPKRRLMIRRNTALPARQGAVFKTQQAGQRSVVVKVVEGGDDFGHNATHIGKCVVEDLPPGLPAETPVEVFFRYARNGRLTVKARLPSVERAAAIAIERASGLSDEGVEYWRKTLRLGEGLVGAEPATSASDQDEGMPPLRAWEGEPVPLPGTDEQPPPFPPSGEGEPPPIPPIN